MIRLFDWWVRVFRVIDPTTMRRLDEEARISDAKHRLRDLRIEGVEERERKFTACTDAAVSKLGQGGTPTMPPR